LKKAPEATEEASKKMKKEEEDDKKEEIRIFRKKFIF